MSHKHIQAQGGVTQKDANVRTDVQQKPFVDPDPKIPCFFRCARNSCNATGSGILYQVQMRSSSSARDYSNV
uniref:HDC15025 n=1 Tax=Drosophila melanogaster TaxID=7227 RepID=Q6IJF0_DROME|nr:TPA_inf: HDC15025 [Drosophila melanogaster]